MFMIFLMIDSAAKLPTTAVEGGRVGGILGFLFPNLNRGK